MKKILVTFIIILMAALPLSPGALADVDLSRDDGVISVLLEDSEGNLYSGVRLRLYRVADASAVDGAFAYTLTGGFEGSGADLDNITTSEGHIAQAALLRAWALGNAIGPYRPGATTPSSGMARFDGLPAGMYLLIQGSGSQSGTRHGPGGAATSGTVTLSSVLIPVPQLEGGTWSYDVSAAPKLLFRTPTRPDRPPDTPDTPERPRERPPSPAGPPEVAAPDAAPPGTVDLVPGNVPLVEPEPESEELEFPDMPLADLPQTGLLYWPIPVLGALSPLLTTSGVILVKRSKRDKKD